MTEVDIKNKQIYLLQITRGSLQIANNLVQEWNRIRTGENFFIQYKLEFPVYKSHTVAPPLPTVKNVIVNDRVLCSGDIPREYAELYVWKIVPFVIYIHKHLCIHNVYISPGLLQVKFCASSYPV